MHWNVSVALSNVPSEAVQVSNDPESIRNSMVEIVASESVDDPWKVGVVSLVRLLVRGLTVREGAVRSTVMARVV